MLRILGAVYFIALALFLVIYIQRLDWVVLDGWSPDHILLLMSTIVGLLYRIWGVLTWAEMLRRLGANIDARSRELTYVYSKAWMGRYIPGKVTWVLGKIWFGSRLGISKERLAVGALVESSQQISVTLLLAFLLIGLSPHASHVSVEYRSIFVVCAIVLVLSMHPTLFNWLLNTFRKMLGVRDSDASAVLNERMLIYGAGLQIVGFTISGLSYFLLAQTVDSTIAISDLPFVVGVFSLAGVVGILSVFAPSGLGVREGVQLLLLPLVMTAELALVLTVLARLWSTGVDLLFFGLSYAFRPRAQQL